MLKPMSSTVTESIPSYSTGGPGFLLRPPEISTGSASRATAKPSRSSDQVDVSVRELSGT